MYGAAQEEYKASFLRELVNLAKDNPHPILIGGTLICLDSDTRKAEVDSMVIGLFFSTQSLTAWI